MSRLEKALGVLLLLIFLGPVVRPHQALPGQPESGTRVARRLLEEVFLRDASAGWPETFVYGRTPDEPAQYTYAISARDCGAGLYQVDVRVRWSGVPETRQRKGSRPMEVHLGRLLRKPI